MTTVAIIGNMHVDHATEMDLLHALKANGCEVGAYDERDWHRGDIALPDPDGYDLLWWTHTPGWPTPPEAVAQVEQWRSAGVPVVGYHLDRWWGLRRQSDVYNMPYLRLLDRFYVADPQTARWEAAGVHAVRMSPGVSDRHVLDGEVSPKWAGYDLVFVGNTTTHYHPEHTHRADLLAYLRKRYGRRFVEIPGNGPAIRGQELADIYATIPVIVGDSCLVGLDSYWSDRVPETIGRGGYLLHPDTDWAGEYEPAVHLDCWRVGDWDGLANLIDYALTDDGWRMTVAAEGAHHVRTNHTYRVKVARVLEEMLP